MLFALSFVNSLCWAFCYVVPMNSPSLSNHRLLFGSATTKYPLTKLTLQNCLYCSCLLFLVLPCFFARLALLRFMPSHGFFLIPPLIISCFSFTYSLFIIHLLLSCCSLSLHHLAPCY